MAEIANNNQPLKGKRKIHSTRVDLTPMVDLGFLLITFFVFTTTMSEMKAMKLLLPTDKAEVPNEAAASGALTLLLGENKVWYYNGSLEDAKKNGQLASTNFDGNDGLRQVILGLKHKLVASFGNDEKMMVIIKPTDDCNFKHTVDVLDEMTINNIRRYALVDISEDEKKLLQ